MMNKISKTNFSQFKKALKLVYESAPLLTVLNFIITFIRSFFPLIIIYLIKELIDAVSLAVISTHKEAAFAYVKWVVIASGLTYLINALAISIGQYISEFQSQKFADFMFARLHDKASKLDLEYYENATYHDMFYRALQESPGRPLKVVNNLFYIIQYGLAVLVLAVFLIFSMHWAIAIVLLIATAPAAYVRFKFADKLYHWQYTHTQDERKAYYFSRVLTNEVFAKELRLFRLQQYFSERFNEVRKKLRTSKLNIIKKMSIAESLSHLIGAAAIFTAYAYIAYGAIYGTLTLGMLVMFYMALQKGMTYFKDLLNMLSQLYEDSLYLENLESFMMLKNKTISANAIHFPENIEKGIVFENVSFKYPNSTRNALRNLNICIKPGDTIAIVGDNGAGKTTFIKLLCGLYQVNEGKILIDDININDFIDDELKANISVMFQDFVLYHLSVKDNIGFGNVSHINNLDEIKAAAKKAGIDTLIENLHSGYHTTLGKLFDNSEELSIGEWQKIAMSRAFFKDAPVIILDEPSSALDPKAEYEIFKSFKEITHGKTSIIVSHRFSTVKMADYIYVLDKETIIEQGSHNELMAIKGKYANMYNLQAGNYI